MAPLQGLQEQLAVEMRSRIREGDSTPPVYDPGWWTWSEFRPGAEYPVPMRQRGSPERPDARAPRQVVLDQPARAVGQAHFSVGSAAVSPNGDILAWTEDTGGRRIHTLRFRNLRTAPGRCCGPPVTHLRRAPSSHASRPRPAA